MYSFAFNFFWFLLGATMVVWFTIGLFYLFPPTEKINKTVVRPKPIILDCNNERADMLL